MTFYSLLTGLEQGICYVIQVSTQAIFSMCEFVSQLPKFVHPHILVGLDVHTYKQCRHQSSNKHFSIPSHSKIVSVDSIQEHRFKTKMDLKIIIPNPIPKILIFNQDPTRYKQFQTPLFNFIRSLVTQSYRFSLQEPFN